VCQSSQQSGTKYGPRRADPFGAGHTSAGRRSTARKRAARALAGGGRDACVLAARGRPYCFSDSTIWYEKCTSAVCRDPNRVESANRS
jgi:hypothetical protein